MKIKRSNKSILIVICVMLVLVMSFAPAYGAEEENVDYKYDSPKLKEYTVVKTDSEGKSKTVYTASTNRENTCLKMNAMANVRWSVDTSFRYYYQGDKRTRVRKGYTYYGLPYTQKNRDYSKTSRSTVQKMMTKASLKEGQVQGLDCSSAAVYALRTGKGKTESATYLMGAKGAYVSYGFLYDGMRTTSGTATSLSGKSITYRNDLSYVGWYGDYTEGDKAKTSTKIVKKLGKAYPEGAGNIYSNVYAKARLGDVLVKVVKKEEGPEGHVMLITGVRLVYKKSGKIDPEKSRFVISDQNQPEIRYLKTEKWISSWRRNYCGPNSSFKLLKSLGYLPVSAFSREGSFTVKYNVNGGTSTVKEQVKKLYKPIKIRAKIPKRKGYTFLGWKPKKDPIKKLYQPGEYFNEDINETLVAQWEKNE
ncbi:MAG: InlB B-repeat-containing protein [Firmicutes bacterium]|nr:InlB B-repeat-containing protein [Bacillota bacterium]